MGWLSTAPADDRGRRVELLSLGEQDEHVADLLSRFYATALPSLTDRVRGEHLILLLGGAACIAFVFVLMWLLPPLVAGWALGATLGLTMALGGAWIVRTWAVRRADSAIATFLSEGRCPSCGYALAGTPREADGCAVCPECSSAWRVDRIGTLRRGGPPAATLRARSGAWPAITDARGRALRMVDPRGGGPRAAMLPPERAAAAARAVRSATRRQKTMVLAIGGLVFVPGVVVAAMSVWQNIAVAGRTWFALLDLACRVVFVLFLSVGAWRLVTNRSQSLAKPAARALLGQGICPACGGDLEGAAVGGDGCRECAGCGAAWRG